MKNGSFVVFLFIKEPSKKHKSAFDKEKAVV